MKRRPAAAPGEVDWAMLVERARAVRDRAYAPYSRFRVGAALLASDGSVHVGCNVENASFGATICAERAAACAMIAAGVTGIAAVVIVGGERGPAAPCGICRQFVRELATKGSVPVLMRSARGRELRAALDDLLPLAFGPEALAGRRARR